MNSPVLNAMLESPALPELIQAVSMARTFLSPEQLKEYSETLERCQAVLAEQAK